MEGDSWMNFASHNPSQFQRRNGLFADSAGDMKFPEVEDFFAVHVDISAY